MKVLAVAALASIASGVLASGAELSAATLHAWDAYLQVAQSRMEERRRGAKPFLWVQESEQRMRFVRDGGILAEPMEGNGRTRVAGGLIYDLIGAVFVPAVTADEVFTKLDDYEDYPSFYRPTVIESRVLARDGDNRRYTLRWVKKVSFLTNVVDGDYESSYFRPRPDRWWSVGHSTRLQEVEHYGRADEALLPVGAGYVWRLYVSTRAMEVDRGVVVEMEVFALSRDIPAAVAWLVNPLVDRISRNALMTTLRQTREAARQAVAAKRSGMPRRCDSAP